MTGIDYVGQALAQARRKAAAAHVAPTWIQGDVTRLPELLAGRRADYQLLLDFGCFHGLDADQAAAYVAGIRAVAAPGATYLLFAFAPARRGPAPHGLSAADVTQHLGADWELRWSRPAGKQHLPSIFKNANPSVYCLRRRGGAG